VALAVNDEELLSPVTDNVVGDKDMLNMTQFYALTQKLCYEFGLLNGVIFSNMWSHDGTRKLSGEK
jgi:hypothetical protein